MKFFIDTLGCKVNAYESQAMSHTLKLAGFIEASAEEISDIYIIHTCAVTNTAAFKSRQKIRQASKKNEKAIIVVVGCYVQTNAGELIDGMNIDILIGSSGKKDIDKIILKYLADQEKIILIENIRDKANFEESEAFEFEHQHRAYLKIQDGCNQFCSYCIIPYTRGVERSIEMESAIRMAQQLVSSHHHEIVLAGIHTGRYVNNGNSLYDLMKSLLKIEGLERLRLSSIEANEINDDLIDLMAHNKKVAAHLHIPMQAGCDKTLKDMNRHYDTLAFLKKLTDIRLLNPNISISSDVIVGFPNESDEDFKQTLAFIAKCELSFVHVFPFSARKGTVAETMKKQVSNNVKKERVHALMALSSELKQKYYAKFIGKIVLVLVEEQKNGKLAGYSSEYIRVNFVGDESLIGKLVEVLIIATNNEECLGKINEVSNQ